MKSTIVNLILCLSVISCTSNTKQNAKNDTSKQSAMASVEKGPFDLAKLTLKEGDAPNLIAGQGVKPEPVPDEEQTLLGYEVFRSSDPKVLKYGNADLSGGNGSNKNHVLFHYDDKTKTLAFYEVEIYNQQQADALLKELQKMGQPAFEKNGLAKGEIALDLNGNEIKPGKEKKQAYRVWENKANGLTYYFGEVVESKGFTAELTVINRSGKYAKDLISLRQLDWYKNN